jgi:hypothetical protein
LLVWPLTNNITTYTTIGDFSDLIRLHAHIEAARSQGEHLSYVPIGVENLMPLFYGTGGDMAFMDAAATRLRAIGLDENAVNGAAAAYRRAVASTAWTRGDSSLPKAQLLAALGWGLTHFTNTTNTKLQQQGRQMAATDIAAAAAPAAPVVTTTVVAAGGGAASVVIAAGAGAGGEAAAGAGGGDGGARQQLPQPQPQLQPNVARAAAASAGSRQRRGATTKCLFDDLCRLTSRPCEKKCGAEAAGLGRWSPVDADGCGKFFHRLCYAEYDTDMHGESDDNHTMLYCPFCEGKNIINLLSLLLP